MNTYEVSEFIERLSANDLPDNGALTIAGLVKHDPKQDDGIAFSRSMSCERWLQIPTSLIEDITHLRNVECRDHKHPLVKIKLKQPDAARSDLAFLLGLVSDIQATLAQLALATRNDVRVTADEGGDCYTLIAGGLVYVCCGMEPTCTGVA